MTGHQSPTGTPQELADEIRALIDRHIEVAVGKLLRDNIGPLESDVRALKAQVRKLKRTT
jgi:hypothetical protein